MRDVAMREVVRVAFEVGYERGYERGFDHGDAQGYERGVSAALRGWVKDLPTIRSRDRRGPQLQRDANAAFKRWMKGKRTVK